MNDKSNLILPWLPENLESLNKQEEENRTQSILQINVDSKLKDHLEIVYTSLNMLYDITTSYKNQTDDELTIQYIGIRLFNSIASSLKLLLAGYYQSSIILQRDILETGFLLDFFSIDQSKILDWKKSNNKQRYNKYRPSIIRKALDDRDGFKERKREQIYQRMCEYAAHPTYQGIKLVAPKGLANIGPFFDIQFLKSLVEELAMRVPFFTLIYLGHFKRLPSGFLKIRADFLDKVKTWSQKYLKLDLSHIEINSIKEMGKIIMIINDR